MPPVAVFVSTVVTVVINKIKKDIGRLDTIVLVMFVLMFFLVSGCTQQTEQPKTVAKDSQMKEVMIEEPQTAQSVPEQKVDAETEASIKLIGKEELAAHNSEEDCWVVYEGQVYDITDPPRHPSMAKSFFRHCGQTSGFEEGAKQKHSKSNVNRVEEYATYVGEFRE